MKREKYDLAHSLFTMFKSKDNMPEMVKLYSEILKQTGLTAEEFNILACQEQTVGQLKYRILGFMEKKKIDSSHIT